MLMMSRLLMRCLLCFFRAFFRRECRTIISGAEFEPGKGWGQAYVTQLEFKTRVLAIRINPMAPYALSSTVNETEFMV